MIAVDKKEREREDGKIQESNESLMKRFNRKVLSAGFNKNRKKEEYFQQKPTRAQKRKLAIRRKYQREQDELLIKTGKKKEESRFGKKKK